MKRIIPACLPAAAAANAAGKYKQNTEKHPTKEHPLPSLASGSCVVCLRASGRGFYAWYPAAAAASATGAGLPLILASSCLNRSTNSALSILPSAPAACREGMRSWSGAADRAGVSQQARQRTAPKYRRRSAELTNMCGLQPICQRWSTWLAGSPW